MDSPVLLIAFNRPDRTLQVWEALRAARVSRVYVAVDGPRDSDGDADACGKVQQIVAHPDWPCDLHTRFADINQGPGWGPRNAITWFLSQEPSGIILEDDTVPEPSMFHFISDLLTRYQRDESVMTVSGTSLAGQRQRDGSSYRFSRYATTWGWGTWRRAWERYDWTMSDWPERRRTTWLRDVGHSDDFAHYWTNVFDMTYADRDHYWDYQWQYACWREGGRAIHPRANLVTNIGLDGIGTHSFSGAERLGSLGAGRVDLPLVAPLASQTTQDVRLDRWIDLHVYRTRPSLRGRAWRAARSIIGR